MSRISSLTLAVVFFCAARYAEANNKCSGITCGYRGECVPGEDKYTCINCRFGYQGGDNKQCTPDPVVKVDPILKPLDQGLRVKKPRGGIFLKKKPSKQVPSDLTQCVAKNCDMCDQNDESACALCDDQTFLSDTQCVEQCPDKTYATNEPKSGRICAPCSSAQQRECGMHCSGYRWEHSACIEGCVLPAKFDDNYQAGTCELGEPLEKGTSCELKCADHAFQDGSTALSYSCTAAGEMVVPSSTCKTSWGVYSEREGNNLGKLDASLISGWTNTIFCKRSTELWTLPDGVYSIAQVVEAMDALKMSRDGFKVLCRKGTKFVKRFPKFTLDSKRSYTLLDGDLIIQNPILYFDNIGPSSNWKISMRATGSFKTHNTTLTSTLIGTYVSTTEIWTLTWLTNDEWSSPLSIPWLEINDAAAVAKVSAGNVTSMSMTGTCIASFTNKHSQHCKMDLLANSWLLELNFDAQMSTLQEIVAKFSKFGVADLGLMTSLDTHGAMTMYVADTPQSVGDDEIAEGVTVVATTKFVQDDVLIDLATGLQVRYAKFTTRFAVGHFANSPAEPTLTFSSFSNHTVVKKWTVAHFGFIVDFQAAKLAFKMTGYLVPTFGPSDVPMHITGTISKDSIPQNVAAVANRWSDFYGHAGLDLVDIVTTCDLTNAHLPVLSMSAILPLGDARVPISGTVVPQMPNLIYLTGTIAELSVKQLQGFVRRISENVISDALSDAVVFTANKVTLSPQTGYTLIDGKETYVYRGLYITTKSQLGGLPIDAAISYNSKQFEGAAMYVSFPKPTALNKVILDTKFALRDAVASHFTLNSDDSAHEDLVDALQLADLNNLIPIPEEVAIAPWNIAQNTSVVSLELEWQEKEFLYNIPASFSTQQSSNLITTLLTMLKFGCRTNNDCEGTDVCSHALVEGEYASYVPIGFPDKAIKSRVYYVHQIPETSSVHSELPLYSTWQCVGECEQNVDFNLNDAGCFPAHLPGESCWGDRACTTNYCPKGKCVNKIKTNDPCDPAIPEACDTQYCCSMCGNTCQDYPLRTGFNCTRNKDCSSRWCREQQNVKACSRLLKKGETCEQDSNCRSDYCSEPQNNKCTTISELGGSCFYADECQEGLSCCFECAFTCQEYPRADGLACLASQDCTSSFCHSGVCVSEIPDGGECSSNELCSSGYCSQVQGNICVRKVDDGVTCGLDDDCKNDYCALDQDNVCFTLIANGETCASDVQCESGFCDNFEGGEEVADTDTWQCAAKLASETECTDDRMCASGKCDVCSWWVCSCQ